jgi:2-polyprenyl-3-methyl-5-hydroxy-6-metoxy-1,4-benzoquinol methylase
MKDRKRARELASEYYRKGDPTGWFEQLYREAEEGKTTIPWADRHFHPFLEKFGAGYAQTLPRKEALIVGCGLGDDAEQFASWGCITTAFDISPSAVRGCLNRFPSSSVNYVAADLLNPPAAWRSKFDFVFEANTLQVLPANLRPQAITHITAFLKPGGQLLIIARGREPQDSEGQMPWPLLRSELEAFTAAGLIELKFEVFPDADEPDVRRFAAQYRRP